MCLSSEVGYRLVRDKLTVGLSGMPVVCPSAKALRDLRRRIGSTPVRALFGVLAGLPALPTTPGGRFSAYRMVSFDGCSSLRVPASERNRAWLGRTSQHGYPTLEAVTLVETGPRTAPCSPPPPRVTSCAHRLLHLLRPDMLMLRDKGSDSNAFLAAVTDTGAQVLGRATQQPAHADPHHQRWEHESTYCALRHTIMNGRNLRSGDPAGIEQEMWSLLTLNQALRTVMVAAAESLPGTDRDCCCFGIALHTARDQVIQATGVIPRTPIGTHSSGCSATGS
ncbi:hypothetical protein GCM10023084_73050 [Streptomyces lacrimifluminis]|uniref:Transposase IS4 N-terminal domain-containing protein n=2 Tax=Streptomyces lacrimifluminis TaxID=1500077 RepID=A0A917P652_9ACTN|nr:hypothetical protein GCM10012282_71130 [Streptomyces lacrimifluminis]